MMKSSIKDNLENEFPKLYKYVGADVEDGKSFVVMFLEYHEGVVVHVENGYNGRSYLGEYDSEWVSCKHPNWQIFNDIVEIQN